MSKGLYVIGTDTDIGKTYVTALLTKKLLENGYAAGYYKPAISGASCIAASDAGYVKQISRSEQDDNSLVSYLYPEPLSPHLASKINGQAIELDKIQKDYQQVCNNHDFVTVEGSGGIVCPLRWDHQEHFLLEDIIKMLNIPTLLVSHSGLGSINASVLTVSYLHQKGIPVSGIILNHYNHSLLAEDNRYMIESLTGIPVIACIGDHDTDLTINAEQLIKYYK